MRPSVPVQLSKLGVACGLVAVRSPVAGSSGTRRSTACMPFWCETRCRSSAYVFSATTGEMPNHDPRVLNGMSWTEKAGLDGAAVMQRDSFLEQG